MAYLSSNNIKVFPSIGRDSSIDLNAELTNEKNLTQILRSLYKRDSFVISDDFSNNSLEFIIHGYYFNATFDENTLSNLTNAEDSIHNIYANIRVAKNTESESSFQQLRNTDEPTLEDALSLDVGGSFKGVSFTSTPASDTSQDGGEIAYNVYFLNILTKSGDSDWTVPAKSKLYWKTSEILNSDNNNFIDNTLTTSTLSTSTLNATTGEINTLTTSILNATLSVSLSGDVSGSASTDIITDGITLSNMTIGYSKVTTNKIKDGAVIESKIAKDAVVTDKIKNESVTLEKLAKDGIIKVEDETLVIFPTDN